MVDELKAVFASDKEGPLKGRVRFIANTRLGAILVVTSNPTTSRARNPVSGALTPAQAAPNRNCTSIKSRTGQLAKSLPSFSRCFLKK
jgi:hypothetical protein